MVHVLKEDGMTMEEMPRYVGAKTTLRLINRKYTNQMLQDGVRQEDLAKDEFVAFWNFYSVPYMLYLQERYPKVPMYLLSTDLINWQLAVFSQLRADFYRLGLGPFECYRFLSSGVHGVFMSFLLCGSVDIYGFSTSMDNFKAGFNHGRPSESHSWGFETMLMRLLYFVGATDICNT
ncbi:hypothetical protein CYMTET_25239 [Cymbomonas tetramitiformis]|uniref:Uncharacterized protein n=1 Tax=Cymbomonas tetramitiformis TaxID=36881 RepID=A0AAE0KZ87_9CHLO|nr:hypothetical protein CYMTET_25239 [Cymbomonas tetramitiformis]